MNANGLYITMIRVLLPATGCGIHGAHTRRRKEIGIRTALGAQPARLLASVFSRAAWQLGLGALAGSLVGGALLVGSGRAERESAAFLGGVVLLMVLSSQPSSPRGAAFRCSPSRRCKRNSGRVASRRSRTGHRRKPVQQIGRPHPPT